MTNEYKLHVRTLLVEDCQNCVKCIFRERAQSDNCFAAAVGYSTPLVIKKVQNNHDAGKARRRALITKKHPGVALQLRGHWAPNNAKSSPKINDNIAGSVQAPHLCQRARHPLFQGFFDLRSLKPAIQENHARHISRVTHSSL